MRRKTAKRIPTLPDPKFNDVQVTKFVNNLMYSGKKNLAFKIFYDAIEIVDTKVEEGTGLETWKKALENVTPGVEVKSRRVGGATFQVPMEVRPKRAQTLAMKWIVDSSIKRGEKTMKERVAAEIMDAFNNKGNAVKKREDTHKMAEANRAFSHYRW